MRSFSGATFLFILIIQLFLIVSANFDFVQASNIESSLPKLSVPEFTVRFVAYPYDVPEKSTTTINPYTGNETVTTTPAYHVENRSIEISIKNQPFIPYVDTGGNEINLYYAVQAKGYFENEWRPLIEHHLVDTSLEYTIFTFEANYPKGGQVDFQVQSINGYKYDVLAGRPVLPLYDVAIIQTSGWSNTQTITIENPEIIPEFTSWILLPLFLGSAFLIVFVKKKNGFGEIK